MIYYYGERFEDWIGLCIYKATDYFVGQRNILQQISTIDEDPCPEFLQFWQQAASLSEQVSYIVAKK